MGAMLVSALFMIGGIVMFMISASYSRDKDGVNAVGSFLTGLVAFAIGIAFITGDGAEEPIRHEVTLRPGHVIDATKYEVVEQRGKIYVIEEREAAE